MSEAAPWAPSARLWAPAAESSTRWGWPRTIDLAAAAAAAAAAGCCHGWRGGGGRMGDNPSMFAVGIV